MNRILLMLVVALAGALFGGACQSQAVGESNRRTPRPSARTSR
jgi:hypothetical protein